MIDNAVVYLGGTMRSGTSLMRALLGSHSKLAIYPRDLPLWPVFFNKYGDKVFTTEKDKEEIITEILRHKKSSFVDEGFYRKFLKNFKGESVNLPTIIEFFLLDYANKIDKPRYGLKTPNNEVFWPDILKNFPKAKFLHLIRDPRSSEASRMKRSKFSHDEPFHHIQVWRQSFVLAQEYQQKYPDSYKVIHYEKLVNHTEDVVRSICDFLGLPFEEEMMKFEGLEGWSGSNSSFNVAQSGQVVKDGLDRFKTELSFNYLQYMEWKLRHEIGVIDHEFVTKVSSIL
jgi:hypothetical protein